MPGIVFPSKKPRMMTEFGENMNIVSYAEVLNKGGERLIVCRSADRQRLSG